MNWQVRVSLILSGFIFYFFPISDQDLDIPRRHQEQELHEATPLQEGRVHHRRGCASAHHPCHILPILLCQRAEAYF